MLLNHKSEGLSLRVFYTWNILVALIVSGFMFYVTYGISSTYQDLAEAIENQIALDKAAHMLMDASDYLTERVQRFTVAGDMKFLNEYFDEAFKTKRREKALEAMSKIPSGRTALIELKKAMMESVNLMEREHYAMRLVVEAKEYTDYPKEIQKITLSDEDDALSPESKMRRATEMVMGSEYYKQKEAIRTSMERCHDELVEMTHNIEQVDSNELKKLLNIGNIVFIIHISALLFFIWITVSYGVNPMLKAVEQIRSDKQIEEVGASEFRYLAHAYNSMTIQLNEGNAKLKDLAVTDALTGTKNRLGLKKDYESYRGREVTVMLLDIEHFKAINSKYGHDEGDRVLIETGKLLVDEFGKDHCYRYGGDEFLVIVPNISESNFIKKMDNVLEKRPVFKKEGEATKVSYSFGYKHAVLVGNIDPRDFIAEADQYLQKDKQEKINTGKLETTEQKVNNAVPANSEGNSQDSQLGVVDPLESFVKK